MGDPKGFLKTKMAATLYRPVCERVKDYSEVMLAPTDEIAKEQTSRCMDCGTPFCNWGCPVGNYIPEWNDLVFHEKWERAFELLNATNNLPEITGRICPAPCEFSCVLGINDDPVTIRENEFAVIEHAFKNGLVKPRGPKHRSGRRVAIVGSGPSGLSCADQLNKAGHNVTVFERDDKAGGIMRYGIPDFKLEKRILDRRIDIFKEEGMEFVTGVDVGKDLKPSKLVKGFDAICLAGGSRAARDLNIPGRGLKGLVFAMDYLKRSNRAATGEALADGDELNAKGKRVVVIGGGDTGSDCIGTANRQGAKCVVQIEVMPKPPECRNGCYPWPKYPLLLKTSTSHEEGATRQWSILTKEFIGEGDSVKRLRCVQFESGKEVAGSDFYINADLVILAIGFVHPDHSILLKDLNIALDPKTGNVKTDANYMTSVKKVFSAGDMHRGQSLIVWAIHEGRQAASAINSYL